MKKNRKNILMEKRAEAFSIIFTLLISIFAITFLIADVSKPVAAATATTCCEQTKTGEWCQNTLAENCAPLPFQATPTSCDATSFCKTGCCYSSIEGTCDKNTPKKLCDSRNGTWDANSQCAIPQCSLGCCVLFNQASLETLVRCKQLSADLGYNTDWRKEISDETICAQTYQLKDMGACVYEKDFQKTCTFTSRAECLKINTNPDDFHKDFLCSAEELGTNCGPSEETMCVEGKDEVYFKDTCGNVANIYDSSKKNQVDYWKKVVLKENSCGAGNNNAKSASCGNCDYYSGSVCSAWNRGKDGSAPVLGSSICRDLNCYDTYNGNDYKHGEAWCIYDGSISNGTALAGSRQWRHLCIAGEEIVEPCGDYRQEICVQEKVNNAGQDFSFAKCRLNNWRQCLGLAQNDCSKYSEDCFWMKSANYSSSTKKSESQGYLGAILSPFTSLFGSSKKDYSSAGGACMAISPSGFKQGETNDICASANSRCDVVYEKGVIGDWKCVQNCECLTDKWVQERNAVCNALGDCGGKKNIVGVYTDDGYGVSGPGINKEVVSNQIKTSQTTTTTTSSSQSRNYSAATGKVISGMATAGEYCKLDGGTCSATTCGPSKVDAEESVNDCGTNSFCCKEKTSVAAAPTQAEAAADAKDEATKNNLMTSVTGLIAPAALNKLIAGKTTPQVIAALQPIVNSIDAAKLAKLSDPFITTMLDKGLLGPATDVANMGYKEEYIKKILLEKDGEKVLRDLAGQGKTADKSWIAKTWDKFYSAESRVSIIGMPMVWSGVAYLVGGMFFKGSGQDALTAATFYGALTYKLIMSNAAKSLMAKGAAQTYPLAMKIAEKQVIASKAAMWGIGVGIVVFILTYKEQKVKTVTFTCSQWQAPVGGADCEKCNKDPFKPCSEYRCSSLGQNCKILNPGNIGNEVCVNINPNDAKAPLVSPWNDVLSKDYSYKNIKPCPPGPGCWKVNYDKDSNGCAIASSQLTFGITTDEPSQCKYDYNRTKFEQMTYTFDEGLYLYNHSLSFKKPGPKNVNESGTDSIEFSKDGNYNLYIVCRDGSGNKNEGQLAVNFCVDKGPDMTPPIIERTSIENNAGVSYGSRSAIVGVYLNEPAECKWSKIDQDYKDMNSSMLCVSSLEQKEQDDTYLCLANLTGMQDKVANTFYFNCKDQPWLGDSSGRNAMATNYKFVLSGTIPLNISSIEPNSTSIIYGGSEPISVNLKVDTINGFDYGKAICSFSTNQNSGFSEFFKTNSAAHEQTLNLNAGQYKYYISCRDLAGNTDANSTSFSVQIDNQPPRIIRAYRETSTLKIVTDEDSSCVYDIKSCNYEFDKGVEMPYSETKEHSADWRTDITYYIKCKDEFGNVPAPASCTLVAHGYEIQAA